MAIAVRRRLVVGGVMAAGAVVLLGLVVVAAWPRTSVVEQIQLDRYVRRRRTVVKDEIIAQADRNRHRMRLRDLAQRRRELAALRRITGDPVALRRYLLRTSMIEGLRRAETIT